MDRAYLVVFEGVEGSGKTTQSKLCKDYFDKKNISSTIVRPFSDTRLGRRMRALLLDTDKDSLLQLDPLSEISLFEAVQRQAYTEKIQPSMEQGKTALVPGYTFSRIAYQGYGNLGGSSEDLRLLMGQAELLMDHRWPDITFILDRDPAEAMEHAKSKNKDYFFEKGRDFAFYERVSEGYRTLADRYRRKGAVFLQRQQIDAMQAAIQDCFGATLFHPDALKEAYSQEALHHRIYIYQKEKGIIPR
ncbi:dTMP kinase [Candidatus Woesearchaeota archaeon]|nr:dTMP kinase [Candidatus Woesearchaeota archaeon]